MWINKNIMAKKCRSLKSYKNVWNYRKSHFNNPFATSVAYKRNPSGDTCDPIDDIYGNDSKCNF